MMVSSTQRLCCVILLSMVILVAVLSYALVLTWISEGHKTTANTSGPRASSTLKLIIVIARHGNRQSLFSFPNDPYPSNNTKYWPYGLGELTTFGRVQMYNLGVKIRSLYNGFLKSEYSSKDLYSTSTDIDRTLISAEAFLAGLYPPSGFQLWNKNIFWQPIPVYTDSLDKTLLVTSCAKFLEDRAESVKQFLEKYSANLTAVNQHLNLYAGNNLTGIFRFYTVWDTIFSEDTEGYVLPHWTKKVYPEPMAYLAGKIYIAYFAGTYTQTSLLIGQFFEEMIGVMKSKVNKTLNPDRQIYFYSGHDTSIVTLQAVLGIPQDAIMGLVKPGSAMIYELHEDKNSNKFSVQVLYIDGSSAELDPVPIEIPGCNPCDFDQFVSITQTFCSITSFEEACRIN